MPDSRPATTRKLTLSNAVGYALPSGALRVVQYQPDRAEEDWYASPAGLRSSARQLRMEAEHMMKRASELDAQADRKETDRG